MRINTQQKAVIVAIQLTIAMVHLWSPGRYRGPVAWFVRGYLVDLLLPFGVYFLLLLAAPRWPVWVRAGLVIVIGGVVEAAQWFGVPLFGATFDPWDLAMYAAGAVAGAVFDRAVFPHVFRFWRTPADLP